MDAQALHGAAGGRAAGDPREVEAGVPRRRPRREHPARVGGDGGLEVQQ